MITNIEKAFHPIYYCLEWLEMRFENFCDIKKSIDTSATNLRIKHAPLHPKIVYKIFGRHMQLSSLFLAKRKTAIQSYLKYAQYVTHEEELNQCDDLRSLLAITIAITGPLHDAKEMVRSLKVDRSKYYLDALQLFECVHLTFFDRSVYEDSSKFVIDYICDLTRATTYNENNCRFCLQNGGLQTETLLQHISSFVASMTGTHSFIGNDANETSPCMYNAYYDSLRSRCFIQANERILTTYESSKRKTIANPIPDVPLPACTGSTQMNIS